MTENKICIVIPVFNNKEAIPDFIDMLIDRISERKHIEIVFVLASEIDMKINHMDVSIKMIRSQKAQRSYQMNLGASQCESDILYFLHIDTIPPIDFDQSILEVYKSDHNAFGCFRLKFDWKSPLMSFFSYFSRFKHDIFHGGDASLFVKRKDFDELGGYNEDMDLMEDYEIQKRLKIKGKFILLKQHVETSAIKYRVNGPLRLQYYYMIIQMMYRLNFGQEKLKKFYLKKIK